MKERRNERSACTAAYLSFPLWTSIPGRNRRGASTSGCSLDPTRGSEIRRTRPCVIVSPDEMNRHLRTVIIAPMTTTQKPCPSRINPAFQGNKGRIILDHLRTIDRARLVRRQGRISSSRAMELAGILKEMFSP